MLSHHWSEACMPAPMEMDAEVLIDGGLCSMRVSLNKSAVCQSWVGTERSIFPKPRKYRIIGDKLPKQDDSRIWC